MSNRYEKARKKVFRSIDNNVEGECIGACQLYGKFPHNKHTVIGCKRIYNTGYTVIIRDDIEDGKKCLDVEIYNSRNKRACPTTHHYYEV